MGNANFGAVLFRKTYSQVFNEGGLWDKAMDMYQGLDIEATRNPKPMIRFSSGAKVSFGYLQYDKDVLGWQGSELALICFDELTHFSAYQFFYMLSRNRTTCGVKPYIRATCNPDADSWVADFIQWWWDKDTGYAIPERSGVVRYFTRINNEIIWGDSKEEILNKYPETIPESIKSFTFIASKLTDNKILMSLDPSYLGNLMAQSEVEKERLLNGNWKIRPAAGMYFKRSDFELVEVIPSKVVAWARSWDLACTEPTTDNPSPDATAGVLMGKLEDGRFIVADAQHVRYKANDVRNLVRNTTILDNVRYKYVESTIPQDAGQAGKEQAQSYVTMLAGYSVEIVRPTGSKTVRATPFASQVQAKNVLILKGDWNDRYLDELEAFPESAHDDLVDASSDAFNKLQKVKSWGGLIT